MTNINIDSLTISLTSTSQITIQEFLLIISETRNVTSLPCFETADYYIYYESSSSLLWTFWKIFNHYGLWPMYFLTLNLSNFSKWNNPTSIFGTVHFHFKDLKNENLKLVSQQYRAWSDCTGAQVGLVLYCQFQFQQG